MLRAALLTVISGHARYQHDKSRSACYRLRAPRPRSQYGAADLSCLTSAVAPPVRNREAPVTGWPDTAARAVDTYRRHPKAVQPGVRRRGCRRHTVDETGID